MSWEWRENTPCTCPEAGGEWGEWAEDLTGNVQSEIRAGKRQHRNLARANSAMVSSSNRERGSSADDVCTADSEPCPGPVFTRLKEGHQTGPTKGSGSVRLTFSRSSHCSWIDLREAGHGGVRTYTAAYPFHSGHFDRAEGGRLHPGAARGRRTALLPCAARRPLAKSPPPPNEDAPGIRRCRGHPVFRCGRAAG